MARPYGTGFLYGSVKKDLKISKFCFGISLASAPACALGKLGRVPGGSTPHAGAACQLRRHPYIGDSCRPGCGQATTIGETAEGLIVPMKLGRIPAVFDLMGVPPTVVPDEVTA